MNESVVLYTLSVAEVQTNFGCQEIHGKNGYIQSMDMILYSKKSWNHRYIRFVRLWTQRLLRHTTPPPRPDKPRLTTPLPLRFVEVRFVLVASSCITNIYKGMRGGVHVVCPVRSEYLGRSVLSLPEGMEHGTPNGTRAELWVVESPQNKYRLMIGTPP